MIIFAAIVFFLFQENRIEQADIESDRRLSPTVYCGIYAAYGAVTAVFAKEGRKIEKRFDELLFADYITSLSGSSNKDIEKAVKHLGAAASSHSYLSWRSLQFAKSPLILHVSGRGQMGKYSHWILFLGVKHGNAVIRDGMGEAILMEPTELLARWDGTAVAVFLSSEHPPRFMALELLYNCVLVGGVGLLLFLASHLSKGFQRRQSLAFFSCASVISVLFCYISVPQTSVSTNIAESAAYQTESLKFSQIGYDELNKLVSSHGATIVDCRYKSDFVYGHIPSAINVPVDFAPAKLPIIVDGIHRNSLVVVYCQSAGCHFSDVIGAELIKLGFQKIQIYRNGYLEWKGIGGRLE